jgi:hypothetical protein
MVFTIERAEREYCSLVSRQRSETCPDAVTFFSSCKYLDMRNALPIVDSSQHSAPNGHKCIACWCVSEIDLLAAVNCSASEGNCYASGEDNDIEEWTCHCFVYHGLCD